jgi:hypothetical protein
MSTFRFGEAVATSYNPSGSLTASAAPGEGYTVVSAVLKMQSPVPGYTLYLAERLFQVPCSAIANDGIDINETNSTTIDFPGSPNPAKVRAVWDVVATHA